MLEFTPTIPDDQVVDLRRRLGMARLPESETGPGQGISRVDLQRLLAHWRDGYDIDRLRARLARVPQAITEVDGLDIHLLHAPSSRPDAQPLLLGHGWPSTAYEFLDVIPLLTEPPGDGPAFHVVAPSMPGFAFSGKPTTTGWGSERIADMWVEVMSRLGHDTFWLHGGDWGAIIGSTCALRHPDRLRGFHTTMPLVVPTEEETRELSRFEQQGAARNAAFRATGFGYAQIQHSRPQTIGYGLVDSPVGLLAWLGEKLLDWSDTVWGRLRDDTPDSPDTPDGDGGDDGDAARSLLSDDQILDVVTTYWVTATGASAARIYHESLGGDRETPVRVPTGCSIFPGEMSRAPRRSVERRYDVRFWRELERGGHFAAMEVPDLLAEQVREFVAEVG